MFYKLLLFFLLSIFYFKIVNFIYENLDDTQFCYNEFLLSIKECDTHHIIYTYLLILIICIFYSIGIQLFLDSCINIFRIIILFCICLSLLMMISSSIIIITKLFILNNCYNILINI